MRMTEMDDHGLIEASAAPADGDDEGALSSPGTQSLTELVISALRMVFDPEIPVNVYDLGLIYRIEVIPADSVEIDMTLTAPGCPVAGEMLGMVQRAVRDVAGVDAKVKLVFDPPWDQSRMSDEAKLELGFL